MEKNENETGVKALRFDKLAMLRDAGTRIKFRVIEVTDTFVHLVPVAFLVNTPINKKIWFSLPRDEFDNSFLVAVPSNYSDSEIFKSLTMYCQIVDIDVQQTDIFVSLSRNGLIQATLTLLKETYLNGKPFNGKPLGFAKGGGVFSVFDMVFWLSNRDFAPRPLNLRVANEFVGNNGVVDNTGISFVVEYSKIHGYTVVPARPIRGGLSGIYVQLEKLQGQLLPGIIDERRLDDVWYEDPKANAYYVNICNGVEAIGYTVAKDLRSGSTVRVRLSRPALWVQLLLTKPKPYEDVISGTFTARNKYGVLEFRFGENNSSVCLMKADAEHLFEEGQVYQLVTTALNIKSQIIDEPDIRFGI